MTKYSDEASKVVTAMDVRYIKKSSTSGLMKNDGTVDTNQYISQHQSLSDISGEVTCEKLTTPDTGYFATYVIKQGSSSSKSQVGTKINIPKDYLVKSASVETCTVADVPVQGLHVGDKYLDFVVNTRDSQTSTGDEHIYIPLTDFAQTYNADGTTITLSSNNTFSVASSKVSYWDGKSDLSTSDVDTEIEAYLDALAEAINPTTP